MNTLLVLVGFAAFFSFLALTQELHEIAQEPAVTAALYGVARSPENKKSLRALLTYFLT